jgi:hypothetical protein
MVLSACPDIVDYAKGGISNWRMSKEYVDLIQEADGEIDS